MQTMVTMIILLRVVITVNFVNNKISPSTQRKNKQTEN